MSTLKTPRSLRKEQIITLVEIFERFRRLHLEVDGDGSVSPGVELPIE